VYFAIHDVVFVNAPISLVRGLYVGYITAVVVVVAYMCCFY
jgi:hypothetical protein